MVKLSQLFLFLLAATSIQCQKPYSGINNTDIQPINLRTVCRLPNQIIESSGIAIEGSNRIWSHEDANNTNEIYCFDTTGTLLRTLTITGVQNIDWEDMAVDNEETWFIGDAGNNNNNRTDLAIYRIPTPESISGNSIAAGIIRFTFEDQTAFPPPSSNRNFDIESMIWHDDSLYMFTKDRSNPFTGITKMYVLPDNPGTYIARLVDSYFIGNTTETGRITSADINHHTGELILLTNSKLVSFTNYPGNRFFDGEVKEYVFTTTPGQNEGIAFVSNNKLYMTEEGSGNTAGYLYEIKLPVITSVNDQQKPANLINVFPNPVDDKIQINSPLKGYADIEIRDLRGNLLVKQNFINGLSVNTGNYPPGIYVLSLITTDRVISLKVIKL
jgi:hypothetical protein